LQEPIVIEGDVRTRSIFEPAISRTVVHVAEVAADPPFAPFLPFAQSVPFTSVLSAPMIASDGRALGVISVQSRRKFAPTELEIAAMNGFMVAVADRLAACGTRVELARLAIKLADDVQPDGFRCVCGGTGSDGGPCGCGHCQ
jgi:GAF domain-containing protein